MKVAVIGMGLIGGSLYKAALQAGYSAVGFDRQDTPRLEDCDLLLMALPQEALAGWFRENAHLLKPGTVAVDTCGVKVPVCNTLRGIVPRPV